MWEEPFVLLTLNINGKFLWDSGSMGKINGGGYDSITD